MSRGGCPPWEASDAGTGVTANIQAIRRARCKPDRKPLGCRFPTTIATSAERLANASPPSRRAMKPRAGFNSPTSHPIEVLVNLCVWHRRCLGWQLGKTGGQAGETAEPHKSNLAGDGSLRCGRRGISNTAPLESKIRARGVCT